MSKDTLTILLGNATEICSKLSAMGRLFSNFDGGEEFDADAAAGVGLILKDIAEKAERVRGVLDDPNLVIQFESN